MMNPWLTNYCRNPGASLRLFCFPYAGGGASVFRTWGESLPASVEVCPVELPGRETRLKEAPFTRLVSLVDALLPALLPHLDKPFALFGHSMGALVAFELARELSSQNAPGPVSLFVSGSGGPQTLGARPSLYDRSDPELRERLRRLNGTPKAVLDHEELMRLILPIIRADLAVCETYTYEDSAPLSCPILAFGGMQDRLVTPERLKAWGDQTRSAFSHWMLPGDHFFLHSAQRLLLWILAGELERIVNTFAPSHP